MKLRKEKSGLCRWGCGRKADNRSGICYLCWIARAAIAAKRYLDEAAKPKRVLSGAHKAKLKAGRKGYSDAKKAIPATLEQKEG